MLIRDVKREDAAGSEVTLVEIDGPASSASAVESHLLRRRRTMRTSKFCGASTASVERPSPSAMLVCAAESRQVGEEILRNGRDRRVDLVEVDAVAGLSVSGDGSNAETDDPDVAWAR